jgi:ABC-type lipopolysaccharide export system ATPase subunit
VLMVEQHARKALRYADRVYVMRRGRIEMAATAQEASRRITEIENVYLSETFTSRGMSPGPVESPASNNRPS